MTATTLRAYQVKAAHDLSGWMSGGERELLLESPVGSGKTTTVKAWAADLLASGVCRLVVVLVPQNLLKNQWATAGEWKIERKRYSLPKARVIDEGAVAELTPDFWRNARGLVVVTRQALTSTGGRAALAKVKGGLHDVLVVADEGHHCADENLSGKTLAALRAKGATTLLVSATPFATRGAVGGEDCKAHRFPEYEYVMTFGADDPSRPPGEFVIDRVFVGKPVSDAEATIDRSGQKGRKVGPEDDRSAEMIKAMAKRWKADGFPCAVFNIPRQTWAEQLAKALLKVKPGADLLNLVGDDMDADAKDRLALDSKATRWADVKISAVLSCARMDEGIDWVPCSHIYNVGIPASPTLILQRWGRAARAKRKIEGYPEKWASARWLVFFTPPGTGEGDSWKMQTETAWLLGGWIADYNAAREWTHENVARGIVGALPVPPSTPEVQEWQGKLAAQIQRSGGTMTPKDARLWLVRKGVSSEVVEAVVKRAQMLVKEVRTAVATLGLQIKPELRAEAERLIEETPLQSAPAFGHMVSMTALGIKEIGERMQASNQCPWEGMDLLQLSAYRDAAVSTWMTRTGTRPTLHSPNCVELAGRSWSALNAAFRRLGESMFGRKKRSGRSIEATAIAVARFCKANGREPVAGRVKMSDATEEQRLGHGLRFMRNKRPDLCDLHSLPRQADRGANWRHGQRARHGRRCDDDANSVLQRLADDAVGKMGVALGGVRLPVPQHLADDRQRDAAAERVAGERVPKIVEADIRDAHGLADVLPRQVEARQLPAGARVDDEALLAVAGAVVNLPEQGHDLRGHGDVALAGLRVGQVQAAVLPVDHGPGQVENLVAPQAGERQKLQGPDAHPVEVPLAARRDLQAAQHDLRSAK